MTCEELVKQIPLYWYGELPPDEEEQVEDHLHSCLACTGEWERQRSLAAVLDRRQSEVTPAFLEECRRGLALSFDGDPAQAPAKHSASAWRLFLEAMAETFRGLTRIRQPLGAMALLALGFFAARFTTVTPGGPPNSSGYVEPVYAAVRSVQPDATGGVQIAFDETRRHTISGSLADQNIRRLLLAGVREDKNDAVRVESMDLLKAAPADAAVRDALLNALAHDPNPFVRLKAVEGLKPLGGDELVRKTLAKVLSSDDNQAVRMQVIDLLVEKRDDSMVGVLQGVVQKDNNNYVRLKCEKALKDWNASSGTF
jgi:hypothetical protein